jgi:WD40 repeat protein
MKEKSGMRKLITLLAGLVLGGLPVGLPGAGAEPPEAQPYLVLQVGPRESVTAVAFAPDGQLLASGSYDGKVRVYDRRTGALLRAIGTEPCRGLNAVAFSPDGKRLAGGGLEMDKTIKVWDAQTGSLLWALAGHKAADPGNLYAESYAVAFAPDGTTLASSGTGKALALWDVRTGKLLREIFGHPHPAQSVAFAPDGRTLVSGGITRRCGCGTSPAADTWPRW